MTMFITLPGIFNSGPSHWQTLWEQGDARFRRFQPSDWNNPQLADWKEALSRAVMAEREPPILVAHSLACLLVAHWSHPARPRIAGAFLVSVPDPDGSNFPAPAASFRAPPRAALPFPALVVASADDPYGSVEHAAGCAQDWRAGFIQLGPLGHINEASGVGAWPEGTRLLEAFRAGAQWR